MITCVSAEMAKEWILPSPQMTVAALPTSVMTSSVVTGSNMAYTLSHKENSMQATEGLNAYHKPLGAAGIDPSMDPALQVTS